MRTTLDISDSLFRKLKAKAAMQGITMKELLTRLIEAEVEKPQSYPADVKRSPFPVARRLGEGPVIPYMTNAEMYAMFDKEDAEKAQEAYESS